MIKPFHATAVAIFDGPGDGVPRFRESIIREIERALERAYADGRAAALPEARRLALTEARRVLEGFEQSAAALKSNVLGALQECDRHVRIPVDKSASNS